MASSYYERGGFTCSAVSCWRISRELVEATAAKAAAHSLYGVALTYLTRAGGVHLLLRERRVRALWCSDGVGIVRAGGEQLQLRERRAHAL